MGTQEASIEPDIRGEGSLSEQQEKLRAVACWYFGEDGLFAPKYEVHGVLDYPSEVGYVMTQATHNLRVGFSEEEISSVNTDVPESHLVVMYRQRIGERRANQLDDAARYLSNVAKGFDRLPDGVEIEGVNK